MRNFLYPLAYLFGAAAVAFVFVPPFVYFFPAIGVVTFVLIFVGVGIVYGMLFDKLSDSITGSLEEEKRLLCGVAAKRHFRRQFLSTRHASTEKERTR